MKLSEFTLSQQAEVKTKFEYLGVKVLQRWQIISEMINMIESKLYNERSKLSHDRLHLSLEGRGQKVSCSLEGQSRQELISQYGVVLCACASVSLELAFCNGPYFGTVIRSCPFFESSIGLVLY